MSANEKTQRVQGLMMFLGALSDGLESVAGRGAEAVCFRSGRVVGLKRQVAQKETDIFKSLEVVREEMQEMGINWSFDAHYKRQSDPDLVARKEGYRDIDLPFRNCMVRCTLFRYGFPQGKALCQTKHGLFCGLFQNIYGAKTHLGIVHAGENACLLKLKIYD
jgi:predicted hydrocarbon binding protein